jgi:hypothetical protein
MPQLLSRLLLLCICLLHQMPRNGPNHRFNHPILHALRRQLSYMLNYCQELHILPWVTVFTKLSLLQHLPLRPYLKPTKTNLRP